MTQNLKLAIQAAIAGGKEIMSIYKLADVQVEQKGDNSPLTLADKAANTAIMNFLKTTDIPVISEENRQTEFSQRKNWDSCWIVDPLDGTKEFIKKNGEFTVNIAISTNGCPILGVIYVPVSKELYYATTEMQKAYKTTLNEKHEMVNGLFDDDDLIRPSASNNNVLRVVGSRSHMNQDTLDFISSVEKDYDTVEIVSKGSSLKFCLVAEGKADVYPRFAPTMEWDTAAGHAICSAAGLKVTSQASKKELAYNKEDLLNPYFLVSK